MRVTKEALALQGLGRRPAAAAASAIELETLLYGLLLPSGNDAAIALAQRVGGTVADVRARDERAGARDGPALHALHVARRLRRRAATTRARSTSRRSRARCSTSRGWRGSSRSRQAVLPFPIKGGKLYLYNNNPLLRTGYPATIGVKTGYTDAAGRCLVAAVRRGGRRLGVVLLHSPDPGRQAQRLLDRGFRRSGASRARAVGRHRLPPRSGVAGSGSTPRIARPRPRSRRARLVGQLPRSPAARAA